MKNKIFSFLLAISLAFSSVALTSCSLIELYMSEDTNKDDDSNRGGDTNVDIANVNNYDITITPNNEAQVSASTKALLSAVSVYSTFNYRYQTGIGLGASYTTGQGTGAGSGIIYKLNKTTGDAYIITNYHVVYDSSSIDNAHISRDIEVYLYGQEDRDTDNNESGSYAIPATFIGGSMLYDIAILKVTASEVLMRSNATAVEFANSDLVSVLDTAIAIGNPEAEGISATVGFVNVDSEYILMSMLDSSGYFEIRVMRTDAAVNSGNSGGGLFDIYGRLIGVVNAKSNDSSNDNMGYAIPSNLVKSVADAIIYYCDGKDNENLYRPLIGITVEVTELYTALDTETGKIIKNETVSISSIDSGSLAEGKFEKGDVINSITIKDTAYTVTRVHHATEIMINARVGDTVIFNITKSDGTVKNVEITITQSCLSEKK